MLRLEPDSPRGWFGGRALAAGDPVEFSQGVSIAAAGDALQAAFDGSTRGVTVALLSYEGTAAVLRYESVEWGEPGCPPASEIAPETPLLTGPSIDLPGRAFRAAVAEVRERIASGDVYVLNLTARVFGAPAAGIPAAFEALRGRAASAMDAMLALSDGTGIASVSPERFLRVRRLADGAREAEVWPIKGTRPRGATAADDESLAEELALNAKERAEHVMVVDLERNDLGRVSVPGSVRVEPLCEVFQTPYCHQMVSRVFGMLREDASVAELLEATFPCGSVTGAPKIAAMRIAGELERSPRGAYCGALVVAVEGEIDSSVLIRTLEYQDSESAAWGTGCGITYESDAAAEWLEAVLKASPALGDGTPAVALRETMRAVYGRVPWLDRHLARLASGGCGPTTLARVRSRVAGELEGWSAEAEYGRLSLTVTPDGSVEAMISAEPSSIAVDGGPVLVPVPIDGPPVLPPGATKPAARRFWDRAHRAARLAGGHQAVLVGPDGALVDGSTATLWLVRDGHLLTPPAPPAIAGVAREVVFDVAHTLGFPAEERRLTVSDLEAADEVLLCNAVAGVVVARGRGGPVSIGVAERVKQAMGS